jgi:hypothetical protein
MRKGWTTVVLVGLLIVPMTALAQTGTTTTTTTQTTQTTTGVTPIPITSDDNDYDSFWIGSGYIGSAFGSDAEDTTLNFGGSVGYVWGGAAGIEFLAGFNPDFGFVDNNNELFLNERDHSVNTYMFNAIGAVPIGRTEMFQPYVSGGLGWMTLRMENLLNVDAEVFDETVLDQDFTDDAKFAWNLGAGAMGYAQNVGLRGDIRYFRASDSADNPDTRREQVTSRLLSDLSYWQATIGLAFRW